MRSTQAPSYRFHHRLHIALIIALAGLLAGALAPGDAWAQTDTSETSVPTRYQQRPEADPADVKSPDAIVSAVYEAISRPAGEEPDWDRFRSLFLPEARFIPTLRESPFRQEGEPPYLVVGVEGFIKQYRKRIGKEAFYEQEIHAVTERFGDIAHVFSTYESRRSPNGDPFNRGINSVQLWHDNNGDRRWIVNIFWHTEREGAPIPERYQK